MPKMSALAKKLLEKAGRIGVGGTQTSPKGAHGYAVMIMTFKKSGNALDSSMIGSLNGSLGGLSNPNLTRGSNAGSGLGALPPNPANLPKTVTGPLAAVY